MLYGSLHVDPAAGWFPHLLGHATETGAGAGEGATRNLPLAEGTGDGRWLEAVADLAAWVGGGVHRPGGLAGRGRGRGRPGEPAAGDRGRVPPAGRLLGGLGLPSVLVQEGGYHLETMGGLVAAYLAGHGGD